MTSPTLRRRTVVAAAALAAVCAGCSSAPDDAGGPTALESAEDSAPAGSADTLADFPPGAADIPAVVAEVGPSVVTVVVGNGQGSGVVYREGGLVVTNAHVVGDAREVELELADGSTVDAEVIAVDTQTDLAVLAAERKDLPPATFTRKIPPVGSLVLAMGSPLGFQNSVTAGILSGVGREIPGSASRGGRALVDLLQTDAAISPGNSGGALVNAAGEVIGINEAYIPPSAGAVSIGFAIPATTVIDVVDQLIATGEAVHPYLGIRGGTLNPETARALNLGTDTGVVVSGVAAGSPADAAGLRPGDVITGFDGERIDTFEDLLGALRGVDIGEQVPVEVIRDGAPVELTVTIAEQPDRLESDPP